MQAYSLLDLAPIIEGGTARDALLRSRELARHAEQLGYQRFWMAEHHNSTGIASAATAVALGYVAEGTSTIRVGAAGVMLPNHSPLVIAEQYGTLASLYPDRIDLGLGRAPGTDGKTAWALRRENFRADANFPQDVQELQAYFHDGHNGIRAVPGHGLKCRCGSSAAACSARNWQPNWAWALRRENFRADANFPQDVQELQAYFHDGHNGIRAVPGHGLEVPLWILGSSLFGAQLAAQLGLPYLFASHFAPDALHDALRVYRQTFQPSEQLSQPYCGAAINIFAANSMEEAQVMRRGVMQGFIFLRRGQAGPQKPPPPALEDVASPQEIAMAEHVLCESAVGTQEQVQAFIEQFLGRTQVDELILTCHAWDFEARKRSFAIGAEVLQSLVRT